MPRSATEGKDWTRERVLALSPTSVLDIGPGVGTYSTLLRPHLPNAWFGAVEIFAPYVETYGLMGLYDHVTIGDAREVEFNPADVVILGDVLEHMPFDDALKLWDKARSTAKLSVFLSLPIIEYPQGACEGNEHEAHLHTWDHVMVMDSLPGITDFATYSQIGVYQA
jgi:hypothetical protein